MALDGITNVAVGREAPVIAQLPQPPLQQWRTPLQPVSDPPYLVNLSPEAKSLSSADRTSRAEAGPDVGSAESTSGLQECQTCRNRRYVDRSSDPTVSFQSPTNISPSAAEGAVRAHEQEHVSNEQQKAEQSGRKVVSQTVTIHYGICPECGRSYVAGGTTTTVTRAELQPGASSTGGSSSLTGGSVDLRV